MNSPARRVLGNKDKNASLKSRSTKDTLQVPSSAPLPKKPSAMSQVSSSPQAGTKRKIVEVEDAERVEPDHDQNADSQRTQLLSDSDSDAEADHNHAKATSSTAQATSYETAGTSFSASAPASQQNPIEPQFELQQDEMSQRTLDKLSDVPMPQNTSQLPPMKPFLLKDMSAGSVGLSSFINFEGPPSTQGSDGLMMLEEAATIAKEQERQTATITKKPDTEEPSEDAARKKMLEQKAAELRTRLQLALYKVETKQTSQPFSRLKTPKRARDRSSSPPGAWMPTMLATPQLSSSTIKAPNSAAPPQQQQDEYNMSVSIDSAEAHIASMRHRAANQIKPAVRDLNSLPMPVLDPALVNVGAVRSYDSNRTMQMAGNESGGESGSQGSASAQNYPSSPPLSRVPSGEGGEGLQGSGQGPIGGVTGTPQHVQLSSPPASERGSVSAPARAENAHMKLTKTVSQGEAASGLVALMTGAGGI